MTPYSSWAADVTNASGDFSVAGKATVNSAEVSGGLTVNGSSTLKGNVTFDNNVTIGGGLTVKTTGSFSGYGTIPVGGIIMWSGSTVPDGWAICNGQTANGLKTPNLADRFILGVANASAAGGTGGSSSVKLTVGNLPSHNHLYAGDDQVSFIHDESYNAGINVMSRPGGYDASSSSSGSGTIYRSSNTGSGQSFSIMPPYYRLAFIMRVR